MLLPWLFSHLLYPPRHSAAVSAHVIWKPALEFIVLVQSLPSIDSRPSAALMGVKGSIKAFTYFYLWSASNLFSLVAYDEPRHD